MCSKRRPHPCNELHWILFDVFQSSWQLIWWRIWWFLFNDFLGVCRGAVAGVRSAFDRSPEEHHGRRDGGVHRRQTPASAASRLWIGRGPFHFWLIIINQLLMIFVVVIVVVVVVVVVVVLTGGGQCRRPGVQGATSGRPWTPGGPDAALAEAAHQRCHRTEARHQHQQQRHQQQRQQQQRQQQHRQQQQVNQQINTVQYNN